jgi:hypothetical protein
VVTWLSDGVISLIIFTQGYLNYFFTKIPCSSTCEVPTKT